MNAAPDIDPESLTRTLESWKPVIKLAAYGFAAVLAALGGSERLVGVTDDDLRHTEARAAVGNAQAEAEVDYEALASMNERAAGACDAALEGFARHREDDRDFAHVLELCHSEGGIE